MPPLHAHDEDESYYVLEGDVTFYIAGDVFRVRAGDVVAVPNGVARTFRAASERARLLLTTTVRSLARYEEFVRARAVPGSGGWPSAEEEAAVTAIAAANGISVLGPPGMLPFELAA